MPVEDRFRGVLESSLNVPEVDVCEAPSLVAGEIPPVQDMEMPGVSGIELPTVSPQRIPTRFDEPDKMKRFVYVLRGIDGEVVDSVILKLTYEAMNEGRLQVRSPQCREPLLKMLAGGTKGTDFDNVYKMLLASFAGPDDRSRIGRLNRWAERLDDDRVHADLFRAETRYWLNIGESEAAVDAANRMEAAYRPYAIRACRLRALAHASSGDLASAKADIAAARTHRLPRGERLELLYIEAWISLQDGNETLAKRNLLGIVRESPRSAIARKAKKVLESMKGEGK